MSLFSNTYPILKLEDSVINELVEKYKKYFKEYKE